MSVGDRCGYRLLIDRYQIMEMPWSSRKQRHFE